MLTSLRAYCVFTPAIFHFFDKLPYNYLVILGNCDGFIIDRIFPFICLN